MEEGTRGGLRGASEAVGMRHFTLTINTQMLIWHLSISYIPQDPTTPSALVNRSHLPSCQKKYKPEPAQESDTGPVCGARGGVIGDGARDGSV